MAAFHYCKCGWIGDNPIRCLKIVDGVVVGEKRECPRCRQEVPKED